jgi:hypothetical protein
MEGLGTEEGNKDPVTFLELIAFTFLSFGQKTRISEEWNKVVKLASREPNDFIASNWFMAPQNVKIFQMLEVGVILKCRTTL